MARLKLRDAITILRDVRSVVAAGQRPTVVAEGDLEDLAAEEVGYRRITDNAKRDLTTWDHARMLDIAYYIYRRNHLGRRVIHLIEDFVVGSGIQVSAKNEELQDAIETFWKDPVNGMEILNGPRVREWQLWGEICLPVRERPDGFLRLGWIDPSFIKEVKPSPATGLPGTLDLTTGGEELLGKASLRVISFNEESQRLEGDCFFETINSCLGGRRGVSEIYTAADWIDALEEILFSSVDRSRLLNSFIWDVTLDGFNETQVKAWLKRNSSPPAPASIRAHNQKVKWQAEAPTMQAYETSRQSKDLLAYTLGGLGIPSHWYGAGDEANLATAAVMAEPTRRMLKRKQREFSNLLQKILEYQIERLVLKGTLKVPEEERVFEVKIPDFSGPDIAKSGAAIAQAIAAIQSAEESGYISKRTARNLAAATLGELGPEIDPDAQEEEVEKEQVERQKEDQKKADQEKAASLERENALRQALKAAGGRAAALPPAPAREEPGT